jgi:hypothetical protein
MEQNRRTLLQSILGALGLAAVRPQLALCKSVPPTRFSYDETFTDMVDFFSRHYGPKQPILKPFGPKAHALAFGDPKYDAPITIIDGSVRSSKTWAMIVKMFLLGEYDVPGIRLAGYSRRAVQYNMLDTSRRPKEIWGNRERMRR